MHAVVLCRRTYDMIYDYDVVHMYDTPSLTACVITDSDDALIFLAATMDRLLSPPHK